MTHVSQFVFASPVECVLADIHHLFKENVPDLRETATGGLHKSLQDGADVRLHAVSQELLGLGQHQSWKKHIFKVC